MHPTVVRHPLLFPFWCFPHDDKIGFLVCGSVVRAPEGTFGAAVAEGGVVDLLKVLESSLDILIHSLNFVLQFYKFTAGELLSIVCPSFD